MPEYNETSLCINVERQAQAYYPTVLNLVYESPCEYEDFHTETNNTMFFIVGGEVDFLTDYERFSLKKGDFFFAFSKKRYKIENVKRAKVIYVIFDCPLSFLEKNGVFYTSPVKRGYEKLIPFFKSTFQTSLQSDAQYGGLALILTAMNNISPKKSTYRNKTQAITDIIKYINKNYQKNLVLQDLCKKFYTSYNYASQLIKKHVGTPFASYLAEVRLSASQKLLANTDTPIKEIAKQTGYKTVNYFYKTFKDSTGITPAEYRQKYKKI